MKKFRNTIIFATLGLIATVILIVLQLYPYAFGLLLGLGLCLIKCLIYYVSLDYILSSKKNKDLFIMLQVVNTIIDILVMIIPLLTNGIINVFAAVIYYSVFRLSFLFETSKIERNLTQAKIDKIRSENKAEEEIDISQSN